MKRILITLSLAILAFMVWLALRQPKRALMPVDLHRTPSSTTNVQASIQTSINLSSPPLFPAPSTNILVRPTSVDEETWNRWLAYRQFILEQNPTVEFYARVVDQNEQPVKGAKLTLQLSRMEGMAFATTNFSAWDPAKAIQDTYLTLYSDSNGWIQLTGVTGRTLRIEALVKEGYSWTMPQVDSFAYEPNGERSVGYAEMEDAFDPDKGYIFHLQKE